MLKLQFTGQFKKDYKLALKRGCNPAKLEKVLNLLCEGKSLPEKCKDHALVSSKAYQNMRECHIDPDWLIIYQIDHDVLILKLIRTGSHSDLFR